MITKDMLPKQHVFVGQILSQNHTRLPSDRHDAVKLEMALRDE
jgi:hypothetical protein